MNRESILVIRLGAMGDVLLISPALRALRSAFPEAEIDVLVKASFAPLLAQHPAIDRLHIWQAGTAFAPMVSALRRQHYTHVADLQSNLRSRWVAWCSGAKHRVRFHHHRFRRDLLLHFRINTYGPLTPVPQRFLKALAPWGVIDEGKGLALFLHPQDKETAAVWMQSRGIDENKPVLAMAPGASRATKCWPLDRFQHVARHFAAQGMQILALGGPEDTDACLAVSTAAGENGFAAAGEFSRMETAAALHRSTLLLSNDTGLMHMACALDVPVAALFGPTTAHFGFFPFRARASVVEVQLKCRPCSKHGTAQCPKGHFLCMKSIQTREVIDTLNRLLCENKRD